MTQTRHNCSQTQWKGLSIKSDIFFNLDNFNRRLVTQFPKVALDYAADLSTYCPTRKIYSDLHCVEAYSHSVQNTYISYGGPKFTDCFVFHVGTLHCQSNDVLWGYSVRQRSYKKKLFIFRISFVVEIFMTIHSVNKVLGHTIKNI